MQIIINQKNQAGQFDICSSQNYENLKEHNLFNGHFNLFSLKSHTYTNMV